MKVLNRSVLQRLISFIACVMIVLFLRCYKYNVMEPLMRNERGLTFITKQAEKKSSDKFEYPQFREIALKYNQQENAYIGATINTSNNTTLTIHNASRTPPPPRHP